MLNLFQQFNTFINKILYAEKEVTKEERMWDTIMRDGECPECGAKESMLQGPCGGSAMNIMCDACGTRYWISGERAFGAEKL